MYQKTDSKKPAKESAKKSERISKKFLSVVAFQIDFLLSIAQIFGYYNDFSVLRL